MRTLILCTLALVAGCNDAMMGDYEASMDGHLAQLNAAADVHVADLAAAQDLDTARALVAPYVAGAERHLGALDQDLAGMRACHDIARGNAGMSEMESHMGSMRAEMAEHQSRMATAADLPAARDEATRHHDSMRDETGRMRVHAHTMMSTMHDYMCH